MLCSKQSYNASNNNCFSSCPSSIDKCLKVPRGSVQRCCSVSPLSARAASDNLFQTFHTTFFRGQGHLQRSPAFLNPFIISTNTTLIGRSLSEVIQNSKRPVESCQSFQLSWFAFSGVFGMSPDDRPFGPARDVWGNYNLSCTLNHYTNNLHTLKMWKTFTEKQFNPLQELIWSTSAYLSWRGRAFTYQLGRSEVVLVSKTDDKPKISTDLYLCQAINWCGNQCRAAVFKSRWYRLLCRLCKLQ